MDLVKMTLKKGAVHDMSTVQAVRSQKSNLILDYERNSQLSNNNLASEMFALRKNRPYIF